MQVVCAYFGVCLIIFKMVLMCTDYIIVSLVSDKHRKFIFSTTVDITSYTLLILAAVFTQFGCVSGHLISITRENVN